MAEHSGTLDMSLPVDDRIIEVQNHSSSSAATSPSSSTAASPSTSDPTLLRTSSFSRLNAKAPEFVPRSTSSSSMPRVDVTQPLPKPMHAISTPQPPPPGVLHVYPGPNPGFRLPVHGVHMAVPPQNHHHSHPHHVPVQFQQHHNNRHRPQYIPVGFVDPQEVQQKPNVELDHVSALKNGISEDSSRKIVNQVEYYFSDINLATTDHLIRVINKDADGFVPMSVVANFKKIKALISSNSQLADILRNSTKLVVSEDGKKIRRQHPLTDSDMEELQSRIVVAENLPEDHCHQNLMKIFSAVGSVKTIRTCQPLTSSGGASSASRSGKADSILYSNKLHAFVEYESVEIAEKAVAELNDKANWRSGLRLRLLLKRTAKSTATAQTRGKKYGLEGGETNNNNFEEDETGAAALEHPPPPQLKQHFEVSSDSQFHEYGVEERENERDGGMKKGQRGGRGRGKGGRGRGQYNNRGTHHHHHHHHHHHMGGGGGGTLHPLNVMNNGEQQQQQPSFTKQPPPGPRMPDGTRGFSMGRGKPLAAVDNTAAA